MNRTPIKTVEIKTETHKRLERRRLERFLAIRIPFAQFQSAARLPGKALAVYLLIHWRRTVTGQSTVTLPTNLLHEFGIDRNAKHRALRDLEEAGLIKVTRAAGQSAQIGLTSSRSRPKRRSESK